MANAIGAVKPLTKKPRKLYRAGLNRKCPVHFAHVGGILFAKHTEKVSGSGSETLRERKPGALVRLRDDQVELIRERIANRVVRARPSKKGFNAQVYDQTSNGFEPADVDEPLAKWAYLEPLEEEQLEEQDKPSLLESLGDKAREPKPVLGKHAKKQQSEKKASGSKRGS